MNRPPSRRRSAPPSEKPTLEGEIEAALRDSVQGRQLHELTERVTQIVMAEHFSGPLPHPRHLADYDAILPGAAERIISMAEANLSAHLADRDKALSAEIWEGKRGMNYGAGIFALLIICAAVTNLWTGGVVVPGLFLGAAAVGGVTTLIKGRNGGSK